MFCHFLINGLFCSYSQFSSIKSSSWAPTLLYLMKKENRNGSLFKIHIRSPYSLRRKNCLWLGAKDASLGAYLSYVRSEHSAGNNATGNFNKQLLDDLSYNTRSNCSSAFSDSESQSFFDRDRSDQGNRHCDVVSRHAHFSSFR